MSKVTVIGAGNVGSTTALRLAEKKLASEVILLDAVEGIAKGKALDIWQSASIENFYTKIIGTNSYKETANSDLVIITAGMPRKPGMSRDDLLSINAKIVKEVTEQIVNDSPQCVIIVVSNPLDIMAYVALKVSGFDRSRVIGMAGALDSARFKLFIANELGISPSDIQAMVLGGHGDSMVPLIKYTTVNGVPLAEFLPENKIKSLVDRTKNGGIEIVNFLKVGSAYYAPSSGAIEMADSILNNRHKIIPSSVWLQGEYGIENTFCGVPVKLGKKGMEKIINIKLTDEEAVLLKRSAEEVKNNIEKLKI